MGGVSGPAIRPMALAKVWELTKSVSIPIVGIGGIATGRDALEFLITGAAAVQLGTILYVDPRRAESSEELRVFCRRKGIAALRALIGTLTLPPAPGAAPAARSSPGTTLEARAMSLFKRPWRRAARGPLEELIGAALAGPGAAPARAALDRLLSAERARLVKLKTLGLTGDFEMKIRLTDGMIALTRGRSQGGN